MEKYLEAGKIINTKGLKGEMKVESYCDSPEDFCSLKFLFTDKSGKEKFDVLCAKVYKDYVYIMLKDIDSLEKAEKMRNKILFVDREDIPLSDGQVFVDDIIGLCVIDFKTNECYGILEEVMNFGGSDIYRVVDGKKEHLIPAVDEFIEKIDLDKGIFINTIPGLIDSDDDEKSCETFNEDFKDEV